MGFGGPTGRVSLGAAGKKKARAGAAAASADHASSLVFGNEVRSHVAARVCATASDQSIASRAG